MLLDSCSFGLLLLLCYWWLATHKVKAFHLGSVSVWLAQHSALEVQRLPDSCQPVCQQIKHYLISQVQDCTPKVHIWFPIWAHRTNLVVGSGNVQRMFGSAYQRFKSLCAQVLPTLGGHTVAGSLLAMSQRGSRRVWDVTIHPAATQCCAFASLQMERVRCSSEARPIAGKPLCASWLQRQQKQECLALQAAASRACIASALALWHSMVVCQEKALLRFG